MAKYDPCLSLILWLIGHCTAAFGSGRVVHAIPVFHSREDGSLSIGVPSIPQIDSQGHVRQRDGKRVYTDVTTFETPEAPQRWQRMVLSALRAVGLGGASS